MPFCGVVAFDAATPDAPLGSVRGWVQENAVEHGEFDAHRANFISFTLVADSYYRAEVRQSAEGIVIGHMPGATDCAGILGALPGGNAVLPHLPREEFALAAWSAEHRQLSLIRDPMGARALYYVHAPGEWVAFASMPEPLLAIPGVRDRIDEAALPALLILGVEPPAGVTVYERLRRVPAAQCITFAPDGADEASYWALTGKPTRSPDPTVPRALRVLLEDAVSRRLEGVTHAAAQLSGGIDSSVVSALIHRVRAPDVQLSLLSVRTYYEDHKINEPEEAELADTVIAHLRGASAHLVKHGHRSAPSSAFLDATRPLADMAPYLAREERLVQRARELGCEVLATGWGGDEMVSYRGDPTLTMLAERRWGSAFATIVRNGGPVLGLKRFIAGPLREGFVRSAGFSKREQSELLDPFRGRRLEGRIAAILSERRRVPGARTTRRHRVDSTMFHTAMEVLDWLGQRYGLRVVHPLQDRDVVEFCDRMPAEWIRYAAESRRAIRQAATDLLPAEVLARNKAPMRRPEPEPRWRRRYQSAVRGQLRRLQRGNGWLAAYVDFDLVATRFCVTDGSDQATDTFRARYAANAILVLADANGPFVASTSTRGSVSAVDLGDSGGSSP